MNPDELSFYLRSIASDISSSPNFRQTKSRLAYAILATDKSLAYTIRDVLFEKIRQAVPGEFGGEYYDTKLEGKGYKSGYISFGLDPMSWEKEGIVGGILIQCNYDKNEFKSEEPEIGSSDSQSWGGHSQGGGIVVLDVTACYYNKLLGGGCAKISDPDIDLGPVHVGKIEFLIDAREKVIESNVIDPSAMTSALRNLIKTVSSSAPEEVKSSRRKKQESFPTGDEKSFLRWLVKNQRSDVNLSEIEALSRAMSARTETAYKNVLDRNLSFFRNRHWPVNLNA